MKSAESNRLNQPRPHGLPPNTRELEEMAKRGTMVSVQPKFAAGNERIVRSVAGPATSQSSTKRHGSHPLVGKTDRSHLIRSRGK